MRNLLYFPAILLGVVIYLIAVAVVHFFFGSIDPKPAAIGVGIGVFFAVFGTSGIWKSQDQSRDRPRAILTIAFFLFIVVWIGMYSKFGTCDIFNRQAIQQHETK